MANIVFTHGLDNKPEADYLFKLWKRKLAHDEGLDLDTCNVMSSMNHWADVLYESPDTNLARIVKKPEAPQSAEDATTTVS